MDEQNKLECQLQAIAVCCTPQVGSVRPTSKATSSKATGPGAYVVASGMLLVMMLNSCIMQ